ncbi:hypothetical protein CJ483_01935 [Bacillus sp. PK3_68]|nr:hypothetical protein CJ483_01935 [Bacillus sp. PK3_68]
MIGMEGAKTPAGSAGQVRPRRRFRDEEAHRPPRGKRSVWNGNQQSPFSSNVIKFVYILKLIWNTNEFFLLNQYL